jgi:hypothetical protein
MRSIVTDNMKILLNSRDAASVCGISVRVWRIWHKMGYTPLPLKIGSRLFWKQQELLQWIDAGCPKREVWILSRDVGNRKSGDSSTVLRKTASPVKGRGLREKLSK